MHVNILLRSGIRLPDLGSEFFLRYSKNHSRIETAFAPIIRRVPGVSTPPLPKGCGVFTHSKTRCGSILPTHGAAREALNDAFLF